MNKFIILITNKGRLIKCEIPHNGFPTNVRDKNWEEDEVVVASHLIEKD